MRLVSSVSEVGDGGVGSEMDAAEMWAGREESEDAVWCLGATNEEIGPLYATDFVERDAVRKERYCPALGT